MGQAAYVGRNRSAVHRHIHHLYAAHGANAVLETVRAYLESWPVERVARLQRADAGWAPFDALQQPVPVHSVAAIEDVSRDIHRHCAALRESGLEPPPELLELDWFLLCAQRRLGSGQARDTRSPAVEQRAV
jgi:hypothetical protein